MQSVVWRGVVRGKRGLEELLEFTDGNHQAQIAVRVAQCAAHILGTRAGVTR